MSDAAAALMLGWLADRAVGDPVRGHPVAGFGAVAQALEARVWRPTRPAGAVYAGALVGGAGLGTALACYLVRGVPPARLAFASAVVWAAVGGRSLEAAGLALAEILDHNDLPAARALLPTLAGRDPSALGAAELCRAGIESVAENTADAVTGPLLWGAVAGPAGVAVYRAANTLDAMVGHRNERYECFGWAAARLDDLLTWPAARLAAGLAVLLAPLVSGDPRRAWAVLRSDGAFHPSPNAGRLEAAFAGALGVALGGVNTYGDRVEARPRIGAGAGNEPAAGDLRRAVRLSRVTGWASAVVCGALALSLARLGQRR